MDVIIAAQTIEYYIILVVVAVFYYITLKKNIHHIFDPLVLVIINFVFSGTLVTWWWFNNMVELSFVVAYWACCLLFIFGFKESNAHLKAFFSFPDEKGTVNNSFTSARLAQNLDTNHLFVFILLLLPINLTALFYSYKNNALAILSQNPELDRVAINAANRWLNVISVSCALVGLLVSTFLVLYAPRKSQKAICFFSAIIFLLNYVTAGSKSAVLILLFVYGVLLIYLKKINYKVPVCFTRSIFVFVPLGLAYFIFVVSSSSSDQGWLQRFFTRLALSGEVYFNLFVENQYETLKYSYNFATYYLHTFTAPLGIKLIPYNIGVALYGGSTGDYSGFGPNPQHVGEGMIFWGVYLAPFYSFFIGYLTCFTRLIFGGKPTNLKFVGFIVLFFNALYLPVDITMWIFNLFSSIIVLSPVYAISKIMTLLITQQRPVREVNLR